MNKLEKNKRNNSYKVTCNWDFIVGGNIDSRSKSRGDENA
jgi:hypothetical protein